MISFDGLHIGPIRDLSLELERGLVYGLLGPSQSGKSELLWCLAGLLPPKRGRIDVFGRHLYDGDLEDHRAHRADVGVVFDQPAILPELSTLDNVRLPLDLRGIEKEEGNLRSRYLLDRMGLKDAEQKLPSELSGGMLTRLQVARALASRPGLLLFDGPTAGLDPVTAARLLKLLRECVNESQATGFVTSHDLTGALAACDAILLVSKGHLRGPLPAELAGDVLRFQQGQEPW